MEKVQLSKFIEKVFETPGDLCEWFGYYNYDTLSSDHTKMLCNRAKFDGVKIEKGMTIELGYFDLASGKWHHIGESDSFNWQQGAMMQWIPGDNNERRVIYNVSDEGHLISKIYDINTGETKKLNWAIYGITPDGQYSIALNMERAYWCRAYHYESVANPEYNVRVAKGDGVYRIDLNNNTRELIIPIEDVVKLEPEENFDNLKHWLEHVMINQAGTKIVFLHRYSPEYDTYQYQTRMCLANIDGTGLQVISDKSKYDWSHFGWQGDNFAIYTVLNNKLASSYKGLGKNSTNQHPLKKMIFSTALLVKKYLPSRLRKKLKGNNSGYQYYIQSEDGRYILKDNWQQPFFNIDGHPSFTPDGRYMITDSYPDGKQMQRLVVYDTVTKKGIIVARLFAALKGTPASCDLHPKLSRDGQYVVVDTAYTGTHKMIVFKLNWNLIKQEIS